MSRAGRRKESEAVKHCTFYVVYIMLVSVERQGIGTSLSEQEQNNHHLSKYDHTLLAAVILSHQKQVTVQCIIPLRLIIAY